MSLDHFVLTRHDENFRTNRNRNLDTGGFITLEQFLLRQEEERLRTNRIRERPGPSSDLSIPETDEREERNADEQSKSNVLF